jgi:hypothetical protein
VGVAAILLVLVALTNLVYHVIRKPTELFAFVGHALDKESAETWAYSVTVHLTKRQASRPASN